MSELSIFLADPSDAAHADAIVALTNEYARDEMGGGRGLSDSVKTSLVKRLREHPTTFIFLAYVGEEPVGIASCFLGFSTFAAKPLLNIHDIAVHSDFRRRGIATALMQAVESKARELGCCKLTLEVLDENGPARAAYEAFGFSGAGAGESVTRFCSKPL